ncbi:MAG: phenylalanine--tRNA ligase subunit beta, partial [Gammaproteobacteria bacterium]|nr:phenylalanine--tRNA ligase subunit beta [Gammaproteobacteria bacterium]
MYLSEQWLREWVNPSVDTATLAEQLTMAGLEVGGMTAAGPDFSGVVVGKILSVDKHPDADKLSICEVDAGQGKTQTIVCGAPNVAADFFAPIALPGAKLPDGTKIRKTKLRGVESDGMICAIDELGLGERLIDGVWLWSESSVPGTDFRAFAKLDDQVLDIDLTPNRGDALSVIGVAQEVAVLNGLESPAHA